MGVLNQAEIDAAGVTAPDPVARRPLATVIDVTTHGPAISEAEGSTPAIVFVGVLAGASTFTLAAIRAQAIENATTGPFDLAVQRGTGVPLIISQGETVEIR